MNAGWRKDYVLYIYINWKRDTYRDTHMKKNRGKLKNTADNNSRIIIIIILYTAFIVDIREETRD